MRAYERLIEYAKVYTTSDPANAGVSPSTARQFDLAKILVKQMKEMGIEDAHVDDKCYVYGTIPATPGYEHIKPLGFVSHMDTSPQADGQNVQPIVHENYDGQDVVLPKGHVIDTKVFPDICKFKGQTLITASGDTLLGADDKAGIAEILTACETILQKGLAHGKLCIGFTPDEEIGAGADGFDVEKFGAAYAYTVDGGEVGEIEYETFNAAEGIVTIKGVNVHPGSAKNIMVNASTVAMEFASLLPADETPEKTEGYEGFYHLDAMEGTVEKARLEYIIRDHDKEKFANRKEVFKQAVAQMQQKYGADNVTLEMQDNYYNMGEVIEKNFHLIENARQAIRQAGLEPITNPVRGGTDGSRLSFMGLPCPNLGTGGFYFHGPNECISAEAMDKAVEVVLHIVDIYAHQ